MKNIIDILYIVDVFVKVSVNVSWKGVREGIRKGVRKFVCRGVRIRRGRALASIMTLF